MQLGVLFGPALLGGGMFAKVAVMGASIAGSLLLRGKTQSTANKLNDLRVSSSTFGRGIPLVYGTMRVTGNMFWSTDFRVDHYYMTNKGKRVTGAKGAKLEKKGKAQEVWDYYANFAMGLCAGPVESVIRIWADNNLIYDKLNRKDKDDPIVEIGFSQGAGQGKTGAKSTAGKGKGRQGATGRFVFRFYKGGEEQLPDSFMKGKTGADKSPGYRGLCYLFFEDFALKDFGNRTPTITAEVSVVEQRHPFVERIENKTPKTGFNQKVGGDIHFCPVRKRIYHKAIFGGRSIIRVFDVETYKEVRRVDIEDFQGRWIGLSHKGDLVFEYNDVMFCDPDTLLVVSRFPGANIFANPLDGIFGPRMAVPVTGVDAMQEPVGYTAIAAYFGVYVMNDLYDFEKYLPFDGTVPDIGAGGFKRIFPGQSGAVTASGHPADAFGISSAIYNSKESVYAFGTDRFSLGGFETVFNWPFAEWDTSVGFQYGGIAWAGAVIGAKALGMIATWSTQGTWAIKFDYQSGKELWRKQISTSNGEAPSGAFASPAVSSTNQLSWKTGSLIYTVDWRQETVSSIQVGGVIGQPNTNALPTENVGEYYWAAKDAIIYFTNDSRVENGEGCWVIAYLDRKVQKKVFLSDICQDVAERCRIPPSRIDTSGLTEDEEIVGYMVENPTAGRSVLEELAESFQFDAVESDNILKFKSRGKNVVRVISQDDLGVVDTDFGGENEYYIETRLQEVDLPERCVVEFVDPLQKYETGNQSFKRPSKPIPVMGSADRLDVTLNMAMTPAKAKTLSQRILYAAWGERTQHEYMVGQEHLMLDPSDTIQINLDNGESFIDRITDIEVGADYSIHLNTVSQHADSYTMFGTVGGPGGVVLLPYTPPPNAKVGIFNTPYLFDDDGNYSNNVYEYYWAAMAYANGYVGGTLSSRLTTSDLTDSEGFSKFDAIWGIVASYVPAPPTGLTEITDTETVIELSPGYDWNEVDVRYTWESISDDDWPNTVNMMLIGDEAILFKNVEELENGRIRISHLVRGYRGSGIAAFAHKTGVQPGTGKPYGVKEEFVIVNGLTVHDADHLLADINKQRRYMITTGAGLPAWFNPTIATTNASTRKPLQVGDIKRTNSVGGDMTISFKRATRFGGELKDGTDVVPLNEVFEKYEAYMLHDPYDKDTWSPDDTALWWKKIELTSVSQFTVTAAEFAIAGYNNKQDVHVVIYQMSDQVGRGFPRYVTIPYSIFGL